MTLQYEIKPASPDDADVIFNMAKDLAQMQDLLHRFCITPETLHEMLKDSTPTTTQSNCWQRNHRFCDV